MAMRIVRYYEFNLLTPNSFIERPNGVQFIAAAGTTEFAKRWNPQPGDIVSFKHHGFLLASKRPKFPSLYRMRPDLTWDTVVNNWHEQKITPSGIFILSYLDLCLLNRY